MDLGGNVNKDIEQMVNCTQVSEFQLESLEIKGMDYFFFYEPSTWAILPLQIVLPSLLFQIINVYFTNSFWFLFCQTFKQYVKPISLCFPRSCLPSTHSVRVKFFIPTSLNLRPRHLIYLFLIVYVNISHCAMFQPLSAPAFFMTRRFRTIYGGGSNKGLRSIFQLIPR